MLLTFPFTIHAGHVGVPLHSLLEPLAFFTGFRYFLYLRKRNGDPINQANRISIFIAAIFGALLGSRLVGGLENPPAMLHAKHILIYFYENIRCSFLSSDTTGTGASGEIRSTCPHQ